MVSSLGLEPRTHASIVEAILAEIDRRGFTQVQLVDVLDEYQPNVSNLLHGGSARSA